MTQAEEHCKQMCQTMQEALRQQSPQVVGLVEFEMIHLTSSGPVVMDFKFSDGSEMIIEICTGMPRRK